MKPLDKNYLLLQFRIKIYSKNGTEFQSFFENIIEKAFSNFKKVPSGGGDGGNDGWIKELGRYYQVYAPNTPATKDSDAARKLKTNFKTLKENWGNISELKEYYFVFNDKYYGSQKPEEVIAELEKENPGIKLILFLAKDLEGIFFRLNESDIWDLGFNIDHRQAVSNAYKYLESVKTELDRENVKSAQSILENSKDIISALSDENLSLEYELLECSCLQKLEKVDDVKEKYTNITKRFPKDSRAFLYLAEIYLNGKDFDKNKELLKKAEELDNNYWLLNLEKLLRKSRLREKINTKNIDEKTFPDDKKTKADFYRLYSLFFEDTGDQTKADSFIEKAIFLNPDKFSNYIVKLSLIENRLFSIQDTSQRLQKSHEVLEEIKKIENKFFEYGDIGARNKAILNAIKLKVLHIQENYPEFEAVSRETFKLSLTCYFDIRIEVVLIEVLQFVLLPENDLNQLLEYLKTSKNKISGEFSKVLIFQFNLRDNLLTIGKKFFEETGNQKYLDIINALENKNYEQFLEFLKNDIQLAINFASTLKSFPVLRRNIIENLPDDKNIKKEKLLLLLNFDEKDFDEAFKILKQFDLSDLSYLECKPILQIIQKKKAWDFEIIILQKLLEGERNEKEKINLQLQLFSAYFNLKKYPEVIDIGEQLLEKDYIENLLNTINKEVLLINTIRAYLERGKIDKNFFGKSKEILEKYQLAEPSFEFKVGIEAEIYLKNNEVEKALASVIEGAKIKKVLSPQEYARLYPMLSIEIGNQIDLKLDSIETVKENSFVKIKNKNQWYFIGDNNELDALSITKTNNKYPLFINRKPGDKVIFENKYGSANLEEVIEIIFSIEKYILWQTVQNFQKLSREGDLEGVQVIEVPQKGTTIDPKYLLKLLEDLHKRTEPLFKIYCKNNIPLAMLAVSEGGLTSAIGRIQQENKGFINFSTGTTEEFKKQKEIAKKVIDEQMSFYIDGTSALFLSETGLLKKISENLPNLRVPQSIISLLVDISEKFEYTARQVGHMGYVQGKIIFSSVDKDKRDSIQANFIESIKLLESNSNNIDVISSANKADCFSEQEISAELSDACILAQKESSPVLTEDFLYLKMNELQTKKEAPVYFSSLALLRVLYVKKQISFNEYLNYFAYLSSYRFRFLSFNSDDIEKAVFGDGKIKIVSPENIRKLNFPLTLSEGYGVPFQNAFKIVVTFLFKVLRDSTITSDITEKIFIEIIESFPTKMNKKELGQILLGVCLRVIENIKSNLILLPLTQTIHEKINKLSKVIEIYNSETQLWIPKSE